MSNTIETKFRKAVLSNNLEEVSELLKKGVDPNVLIGGQVLLSWAVYKDLSLMVDLLLLHGAKVNLGQGLPAAGGPLHAAVRQNNIKLTALLLSKGANPNYRVLKTVGEWGRTPLHVASEHNFAKIAKLLLDAGADPNLPDDFDQSTPVSFAVGHEAVEALNVLLLGGGDPKPYIHFATTKKNIKILESLIKAGASVSQTNEKGWTPLHTAAKANNVKAIEFLIKQNANVNAKTKGDETALEIAEANNAKKAVALLRK